MVRTVTIIALLCSFTAAEAVPRYRPPHRTPKCEKVLVSDTMGQRVSDIAVQIAEQIGALKLKLELQQAPNSNLRFKASDEEVKAHSERLGQLELLIRAARANFTIQTDAQIEPSIVRLEALVKAELPKIIDGIQQVPMVDVTQPRRFMKREIFGSEGPLSQMESWSAGEIENYLRESDTQAGSASPSISNAGPVLPPPLDTPFWDFPLPGGMRPGWPPVEKP